MKNINLKKTLLVVLVLSGFIFGTYALIAAEDSISLNSPTTFPVDI